MWLSYFVGAGLSLVKVNGSYDGAPDLVGAVELGVAHRFNGALAVGFHARGSHVAGENFYTEAAWDSSVTTFDVKTLDVGLAAQLGGGRVMVQPWLGLHYAHGRASVIASTFEMDKTLHETRTLSASNQLAVGVLVAVDVWTHRPDRVSAFVDLEGTGRDGDEPYTSGYSQITLGLAYRR